MTDKPSVPAPATAPVAERGLVRDVENLMLTYAGAQVLDPIAETQGAARLALVPQGFKIEDIGPHLAKTRMTPIRRSGTAVLQDLDSFIAHVKRFASAESVVFADLADQAKPSLLAVLDYHDRGADGTPRFGVHRARHTFPVSEQWALWRARHDKPMGQGEFAGLIEERIADLIMPPNQASGDDDDVALIVLVRQLGTRYADPAEMLELSRGLVVRDNNRVKNAVVLQSGETSLAYESTHTNEAGQPLSVPGAFLLGAPVFENGPTYRIPVRLRYRLKEGMLTWRVLLHRPDVVFRTAIDAALDDIRKQTGLPVLLGTPEA